MRLYEKITGRPHQHYDAATVRQAKDRLVKRAEIFNSQIETYQLAPDPLEQLLADIKAQRRKRVGG